VPADPNKKKTLYDVWHTINEPRGRRRKIPKEYFTGQRAAVPCSSAESEEKPITRKDEGKGIHKKKGCCGGWVVFCWETHCCS